MAKRTFQALAIVLAVSLVALGSFAAGTTARTEGGPAGENTGENTGDSSESFLHRLHSVANRLHSGGLHGHHGGGQGQGHGDFWGHMSELVKSLDLSPEQAERLEAVHRSLGSLGATSGGSMAELHERLIGQFEDGHVDVDSVRPVIDEHLAEIRTVAYTVTEELVILMNSLDARQREIVLAHVQAAQGDDTGRVR